MLYSRKIFSFFSRINFECFNLYSYSVIYSVFSSFIFFGSKSSSYTNFQIKRVPSLSTLVRVLLSDKFYRMLKIIFLCPFNSNVFLKDSLGKAGTILMMLSSPVYIKVVSFGPNKILSMETYADELYYLTSWKDSIIFKLMSLGDEYALTYLPETTKNSLSLSEKNILEILFLNFFYPTTKFEE